MKSGLRIGVAAFSLALSVAAAPAKADTDACTLATAAQVSAAVGFTVANGTHVTPSFVKTCTWTGSNASGIQFVTMNLETATFFDGAKRQAGMMAAAGGSVKSAGFGDDSFYSVQGTQVALWIKKGGNAIKIAVYKDIAADQKQGVEARLARLAVPKL